MFLTFALYILREKKTKQKKQKKKKQKNKKTGGFFYSDVLIGFYKKNKSNRL